MPKFVWEITARGQWAPQLFHGELPREMTARENAHRYVIHELTSYGLATTEAEAAHTGISVLSQLAAAFPPPPPYTGKEN